MAGYFQGVTLLACRLPAHGLMELSLSLSQTVWQNFLLVDKSQGTMSVWLFYQQISSSQQYHESIWSNQKYLPDNLQLQLLANSTKAKSTCQEFSLIYIFLLLLTATITILLITRSFCPIFSFSFVQE